MLILRSLKIENLGSYENQTYYFNNNQLRVIVGINKDTSPVNVRQMSNIDILSNEEILYNIDLPSNGCGKSMISEGINIALFGEVIRKNVNPKDLIRRGEDYLKVTLDCYNDILDIDINIERTISKNKPSTIVLKEEKDGKLFENNKSSIEETNKYILDRYIGISKKDLINYFIIQKDRFKPFVTLSDTEKKEMIANFTGISKIDYVKDRLNEEISKIENDNREILNNIAILEGEELSYKTILNNLPSLIDFNDKNDKNIEEARNKIIANINRKDSLNKSIDENNLKSEKLKYYASILIERLNKIDNFLNIDNNYLSEINKYLENKENINNAIKNINDILNDKIKDKGLILSTIGSIKALLNNLIKCPKCSYEFSAEDLKSKEELNREFKQYEEIKDVIFESIEELENDKNSLFELLESCNLEIRKCKNKINRLANIKENIKNKILNLNADIEYLRLDNERKNRDIELIIENDKLLKSTIEELENKDYDSISEQRIELNKLLVNSGNKIEVLKFQKEELDKKLQTYRDSIIEFNNFKNFLFDKTISDIESICNFYLSQFSNLSILLSNRKSLADGKTSRDEISCTILQNQSSSSFGTLSNGERMFVNLAFIFTFQHIINIRSRNGFDFIELDEIMNSLDCYNQDQVIKSLIPLEKTIEIITHVKTISNNFDTVYIIKENNISQIYKIN